MTLMKYGRSFCRPLTEVWPPFKLVGSLRQNQQGLIIRQPAHLQSFEGVVDDFPGIGSGEWPDINSPQDAVSQIVIVIFAEMLVERYPQPRLGRGKQNAVVMQAPIGGQFAQRCGRTSPDPPIWTSNQRRLENGRPW